MELTLLHVVGEKVCVLCGGVSVLEYHYRPDVPRQESPKPYIHPLATPRGDVFTLDRPHDHPWHRGLYFGWASVNETNLWGGPSYVRGQGYVDRGDQGEMRHDHWERLERDVQGVHIVERVTWHTATGVDLAYERRWLTVYTPVTPHELLLTVRSEVRASSEDLALQFSTPMIEGRPDPSGYSGLTLRLPRCMTGGEVLNSEGAEGEHEVMGKEARWVLYRAMQDGSCRPCTVAVFDHPGNPRHPTPFFVRATPYGVINPALVWDKRFVLPAGMTLPLIYGLYLHSGETSPEQVQSAYERWLRIAG